MVRRQPARLGFLTASPATVNPPRPSARPSARPRCSWQTVSGSAAATSANGQRPSTSSTAGPAPARRGRKPRRASSSSTTPAGSPGPASSAARRRPSTASLARAQPAAQRRREYPGQPGIGAGRAPRPGRLGMHAIQQPGTAGPVPLLGFLSHQPGVPEHRQVLAHRIVVKPREGGELSHAHPRRRVSQVAEQAVARRVPQGPGLTLQVRTHDRPPRVSIELAPG